MSMAGGNPSLTVSMLADASGLGAGLAQAEAQVRQSADRMGRDVDSRMEKFGKDISRKLASAIGAGFVISAIDQSIRAGIEAAKAGGSFNEVGIAFGEALEKSIRGLPIVGSLGGTIADAFLFGLDSVLDYIPQWMKDLDRKMSEDVPFFFGMLSGIEDMRTEGRQAQSRQEALENQRQQARIKDAELAQRLAQLQAQQRGMSPLEEQLRSMAPNAVSSIDTSIGTFRFAEADAATQLVKAAQEQVDLLAEIKRIQGEIADNMKLMN